MSNLDIFVDYLEKQTPQSRGLIPKKVRVKREGKTFESTRWIRPNAELTFSDNFSKRTQIEVLRIIDNLPPNLKIDIKEFYIDAELTKREGSLAIYYPERKAIIFRDESVARNPSIIAHEIAHQAVDDKIIDEYAKVTKPRIEGARETFAEDFGNYITHPDILSRESLTFFEKQFPKHIAIPKAAKKIEEETNINTHFNNLLNSHYIPPDVKARIQEVFNNLPEELRKEVVKIKKMHSYSREESFKLASVTSEGELKYNLRLFSFKSGWIIYLALVHELTHIKRGDTKWGAKIEQKIGTHYTSDPRIKIEKIDRELATIKDTIGYIKNIKNLTSVQKALCIQQQKDYAEDLEYMKTELNFEEYVKERGKVLVPHKK